MRVYSWRIILGQNGILNKLLITLGIIDRPSAAFIYSIPAVILALTYVTLPYVVLAIYANLERIPQNIYDASSDCGASPIRTFRNVIWPLTRPGAAIGFAIAFILSFGDYVTPALVGGLQERW